MEINIGNETCILYVKHSYLDNTGNLIEDILPLREYIDKTEKNSVYTMYYIEEQLSELLGYKVNLKRDFPKIRGKMLEMKGLIGRLPDNLIIRKKDSPMMGDFFIEFGNEKKL